MSTWNPSDKTSGVVLSNGNLTAAHTASTEITQGVRGTDSKAADKKYFEVTVDTLSGSGAFFMVGLNNSAADLSSFDGVDAWLWASYGDTYYDGAIGPTLSTYGQGDVIGVAVDFAAGKVWFAKNNAWQYSGDPSAGTNPALEFTGETLFPFVQFYASGSNSFQGTVALEAADTTYDPPSGFSVWDGVFEPLDEANGPISFVVSDPAGDVDGVISLDVTATGDPEAAIRLGVVDTRSTSLWSATVTLGGTDVSDKVVGVIQVDAEEGAARVASFAIRPAAGVITPTAWTGSAVTLDLVRIINATEVPVRIFTGVVDVATYDPVTKLVSFSCTDDLQNRVAALSTAEIDTVVGGLYHVGAQGQVDEHWDYAQARMESVAGSLDAGALGQIRVSLWDGLTVFDTFDATDILDESPAIELPRRTEIVNRIDIAYEYRYYRCRERHAHLSWSKSQFGTDALASAYQYPTRDTIDAALNGLGWQRISTVWGPSPTKVLYGGEGFWVDTSGKIANVTAHLAQRHAQNVTEAYTLTVSAPASITSNGELAKPLRGRLATQWNPDEWEADFTVTTPDASSADVDYAGDEVRAQSDAAINALLAMAQVQILASHRQARVSWSVACLPEIDLTDAAGINAAGIVASGKVARLVHTLDPDAGTATTQITIALSGIAASGIITPSTLEPPEPPDLDATTGNDEWESRVPSTTNHLGAVTGATYSDDLMGYLVNAPEEFDITDGDTVERVENTYYVATAELPITGFRLRMPGVNDTHRNPVTLSTSAEYDIEIPEDTLTLTV